jgi:hypothetical protein
VSFARYSFFAAVSYSRIWENQIHKRWVWECCFACFRTQSIEVSYSRVAYVRFGGNFQNVSATWQYAR